jgi:4-amino-4-deoxy-L-arabinose transferase-like glycosyltransferase
VVDPRDAQQVDEGDGTGGAGGTGPTGAGPRAGSGVSGRVGAAVRRAVDQLVAVPLVAVVALAVVVRVMAGLAFPAAETDTYEFGWLAHNVVDGRGYSYYADSPEGRLTPEGESPQAEPFPSAYMPPAYTAVATGAEWLSGSAAATVWLVRVVNAAAAAAGVLLIHALARRLVGRRAAVLAAFGYALYPALVYMATQVSAANLYLPLELGVLLLLVRAGPSPAWARWAAAGLALGAVALLRAEAVALVPLAGAWLVWTARRSGAVPRPWRLAALFVCAAAVVPGAWLVRSSMALDTPVLAVTTTGGKNLWIGNHDGASGSQKDFDVPAAIEDEIRALPAGDDFEVRADAVYRRAAIESMTGDPLGTLVRDGKKAALLLGADVHDPRALNPVYVGPYLALAVAGVAGFAGWWRRRPSGDTERWLVVGYVAFSLAVPVVFFALARYRLPFEVMLLVFGASWLVLWADRRHGYDRPHAPASR